jgi:hypothetical protein
MAGFTCAVDVMIWLCVTFVYIGIKFIALSSLGLRLLLLTMGANWLVEGYNE